jgi:hypothetical protein
MTRSAGHGSDAAQHKQRRHHGVVTLPEVQDNQAFTMDDSISP